MKILYGVQGTGNGHISRARIMAKKLNKYKDISVTYLFSGRKHEDYFDMDVFGDYMHREGLTFVTSNGKINLLSTIRKNNVFKFIRDIKRLSLDDYDIIITDFEPISAWAAKLKRKRIIGIGHQYAFGKNTPLAGETTISKRIMQFFAPVNQSFGLHWFPYSSNILPPIIDIDITAAKQPKHVLVYLPFESQSRITSLLQQFPNVNFVQYSPVLDNKQINNVKLLKTNYHGFKEDLRHAHGVICNSGFELISECLHMGIPILTKPLTGQMEQHSNALALQQLNYANVIHELSVKNINRWLNEKKPLAPKTLPDVAEIITDVIISNTFSHKEEVARSLWKNDKQWVHTLKKCSR